MSDKLRNILCNLAAEHDVSKHAPKEMADELRAAAPPVTHPVLRIHPETREPILYINEAYTTRIFGLSPGESTALLDHLFRRAMIPELQCRISWKPGTCILWDNRSLQHYAVGDYMPFVRIMERVTIAGDLVRGGT